MASRVASSAVSAQFGATSGTLACPVNVTAGNSLVLVAHSYLATGTPGAPTITKSSGTATIGTPRTDATLFSAGVDSNHVTTAIIVVPITGSGSLTLQITNTGADSVTVGWDEITGLDATPVKDTSWSNTGTGTLYSTGAGSVAGAGLVVAAFAESSTSTVVYGPWSDSQVWSQGNFANVTGAQEEKIVSGPGSHTLTVTVGTSFNWQALAVSYLDAGGGSAPTSKPQYGRPFAINQRAA